MKILHTADWHLGDRLGRIDRTADLQRAVERVAGYCRDEAVDVLLVAGDLFSELARPDVLRDSVRHWQEVFAEFLIGGGTVLTITGNHDNENFCRTLTHAMNLAAPLPAEPGRAVPPGRFYLAAEPGVVRLPDRAGGFDVQFLMMPYPTTSRYLRDESQKYQNAEERNRALNAACAGWLRDARHGPHFDESLPSVLAAHVHVRGAAVNHSLFRISEEEDVVFEGGDLPAEFSYVALGHIHRPQHIGDDLNYRYSGSVERMDLGEKNDAKSVTLVDLGRDGARGEPELLPLPSTAIYEVTVRDPKDALPRLREECADADNDLVNIHLHYTAGEDNLEQTLAGLDEIFPRWYARDWTEAGELTGTLAGAAGPVKSFRDTVCEYLETELTNHPDGDREELLRRAGRLIEETEA